MNWVFPKATSQKIHDKKSAYFRVKSWADKLGVELWHQGDFITRRKEVQEVKL